MEKDSAAGTEKIPETAVKHRSCAREAVQACPAPDEILSAKEKKADGGAASFPTGGTAESGADAETTAASAGESTVPAEEHPGDAIGNPAAYDAVCVQLFRLIERGDVRAIKLYFDIFERQHKRQEAQKSAEMTGSEALEEMAAIRCAVFGAEALEADRRETLAGLGNRYSDSDAVKSFCGIGTDNDSDGAEEDSAGEAGEDGSEED